MFGLKVRIYLIVMPIKNKLIVMYIWKFYAFGKRGIAFYEFFNLFLK